MNTNHCHLYQRKQIFFFFVIGYYSFLIGGWFGKIAAQGFKGTTGRGLEPTGGGGFCWRAAAEEEEEADETATRSH